MRISPDGNSFRRNFHLHKAFLCSHHRFAIYTMTTLPATLVPIQPFATLLIQGTHETLDRMGSESAGAILKRQSASICGSLGSPATELHLNLVIICLATRCEYAWLHSSCPARSSSASFVFLRFSYVQSAAGPVARPERRRLRFSQFSFQVR